MVPHPEVHRALMAERERDMRAAAARRAPRPDRVEATPRRQLVLVEPVVSLFRRRRPKLVLPKV